MKGVEWPQDGRLVQRYWLMSRCILCTPVDIIITTDTSKKAIHCIQRYYGMLSFHERDKVRIFSKHTVKMIREKKLWDN